MPILQQVDLRRKEAILLRCDKCGNVWQYRGTKKHFASCTDCRNPVRIQENKVETPHPVESGQLIQGAAVASTPTGTDEHRHG